MSYKEIRRYKYMGENTEEEYHERFTSASAMKTGFFISPMEKGIKKTSIEYELWVNNLPEITSLINDIQKESRDLLNLEMELTKNQRKEFLEYLLVEEMQATNQYEGVKSTRQELKEALESLSIKDSKHRFKGLSLLYSKISQSDKKRISKPAEIRELYDELVSNEVEESSQIESDSIFRQDRVTVGDNFSTIHVGEKPEQIEEQLKVMLDFLNFDNTTFPSIIRVIVSHYMFEYIHPFYDGNGRVGRYLLAMYLSFELDTVSSLLISSSVVSNRKVYEKSFTAVSDRENYGEATFFVLDLLELLYDSQKSIGYRLEEKLSYCKLAKNIIEESGMDDFTQRIFWIYFDHGMFGVESEPLTRKAISQHFKAGEWSEHKQRKAEHTLESNSYIELVGEKPKKYKLTDEFVGLLTRES